MSFEVTGEPLHTRSLSIALTQEADDSIGFRADILDLRKGGLMELAGRIAQAGIIHKMLVSGSFNATSGVVEQIAWDQSHVMHEANSVSKGESCRDPMVRLEGLVGSSLHDGFAGDLREHFGGPLGCTHINTLLRELRAFVSDVASARKAEPDLAVPRTVGDRLAARSLFFDAFSSSDLEGVADLSVRLADLHYAAKDENGREQLGRHDQAHLRGLVDLAGWQVRELSARERSRRGPVCEDTPWTIRSEELRKFAEQSLAVGMSRRCLDLFGGRPGDARLLSALLCLGPGMTQVGVAFSETLVPSPAATADGGGLSGPGPCYMLRSGGPFARAIT
jgi:hypothetical protein